MKNLISIMGLLLVITFFTTSVFAENKNLSEVNIKTSAVCETCKSKIEKYVNKMEGIEKSNLNLETKILYVQFDKSKVSVEDIKTKIRDLGYDADEVKRDERAYKKLPKCCQ